MRARLAGKIAVGLLTVVFAALAVTYAISANSKDELYHALRAVTAAVLALTAATCYRYFED